MTDFPILTLMTFMPLLGVTFILLLGREKLARWIALFASLSTLVVSIPLYLNFDQSSSALQFVESVSWIPNLNINYGMGVDGISLPFIFLSALLSVLCVLVSWNAIQKGRKGFYIALLVSETAMIGLFAATNLFLFFIFWELMVVPLFVLIGVWGGPGRIHAAIKFLLFTLVGSVLMLVGIISLYQISGTLEFTELSRATLLPSAQIWLFVAFFAAFAVKVPMFPVHTWLPYAHTEAPTAGSVILAGILLKMGAYGFLRVSLPLFPNAVTFLLIPLQVISLVAIIYGAYMTLAQTDLKRLIAYSSVSHMGFVTLGIFSLNQSGMEGAILQMINHGILSAALFLCVGMIYERTHTRRIVDYGGLVKSAPVFTTFFAIFCLATAGLPGLNSFVGEFLIISGAFKSQIWFGAFAIWGVALGTVYIFWLFYRVAMGNLNQGLEGIKLELNPREIATLVPLVIIAFVLGLYPDWALNYIRVPVVDLLAALHSPQQVFGVIP